MAGFGLNMNNLVSNINRCGQKDLSFEVRHKAYASRCGHCRATAENTVQTHQYHPVTI